MAKKPKQVSALSEGELFPFVLLVPLLLLPPFFRGLFFDTESFVAYMYASLVLVTYVLTRGDKLKISPNLMEITFVGFALAWFLAIPEAYEVREALGDALRNFNYLVIFFLVAGMAVGLRQMRIVMWAFFAAGVGVALAGIGTAYGTFWFNGAYVDGLINSTLQYHNAAAIYLMASGIIGLYLTASAKRAHSRYLLTGLNFLILITAFGAGSRGAMLMGPIAYVFYLIGIPGDLRGKSLLSLLSVGIPFALLSTKVLDFGAGPIGWAFVIMGIVLAGFINFGLEKGLDKVSLKLDSKKMWIIFGVFFVVAIGVLFAFSDQILPATISERIHNFNLEHNSVQERFYFYKDAVKMIKDHPVFGSGGGGWNAAYRQYQGYLYHSTEVHNHPLQVWVETGTFGFAFFISLWISGIIAAVKLLRSSIAPEYKAVVWTAFSTGAALALHSLMDFSLSEGAVSILLWSQFGLVLAVQRMTNEGRPKPSIEFPPISRRVIGGLLAAAFFVSSFMLFNGERYAIAASEALRVGNLEAGRNKMEEAASYDPLNAKIRVQLAQIYSYQAAQNGNNYVSTLAYNEAKKAIELHKSNTEYRWMAAQTASGLNKPEEMVIHAEEAVRLAPLVTANYENLALVYINAGKMFYNNKDTEKAKIYLQKVAGVAAQMEEVWSSKNEREKRLWKGQPLEPTEKMREVMKEAEDLLGKL